MIVYVDLYFVINLTADYLICCIALKLLHLKTTLLRIALASCVGAFFSIARLIFESPFISVLCAVFAPAVMLFLCIGKTSFRLFIRGYIVMYCVCFASGGVLFALLFAPDVLSFALSPVAVFAASFFVFFLCFFMFDVLCFSAKSSCVELALTYNKKETILRLLCDSGCLVREPIGGLPVILITPKRFDSIFGNVTADKSLAIKLKLRLVPIQTASGKAVLSAVMPDRLKFRYKKQAIFSEFASCNAMIARSTQDSFCGYDGLFPKALL